MRYIITAVSVTLVTFIQLLFAQAPDTLWTKTYGIGYGNSVQQTNDGGYIIAGSTYLSDSKDLWLVKTNSLGDTLWTKTFDNGDYETGNAIYQTTDSSYITTGSSGGDLWLIKSNAQGKTLWIKTYGGEDSDRGNDVQETSDGGYVIVGGTSSFGNGSQDDVWLIKTDNNGDTLWTKTIGGIFSDEGHSIQKTTDGGYIIVGRTASLAPNMISPYSDIYLIKTDLNGDTLWTRTFGSNNELHENGKFIRKTSDGGYIIAGSSTSDPPGYGWGGHSNILLIKLDLSGDTLWTKTFGHSKFMGDSTLYLVGKAVQETSDNGYVLIGNEIWGKPPTSNNAWLFKTDANSETQWDMTLSGVGTSIQGTNDGGYVATGSINGNLWLIKFAPDVTSMNDNPSISINTHNLNQNYPNPFNPSTTIEFELPKTSEVTLKVFNILGEEVATLVSDRLTAGSYSYDWDASSLASGVYLYRLSVGSLSGEAGDFIETKKMVLMR